PCFAGTAERTGPLRGRPRTGRKPGAHPGAFVPEPRTGEGSERAPRPGPRCRSGALSAGPARGGTATPPGDRGAAHAGPDPRGGMSDEGGRMGPPGCRLRAHRAYLGGPPHDPSGSRRRGRRRLGRVPARLRPRRGPARTAGRGRLRRPGGGGGGGVRAVRHRLAPGDDLPGHRARGAVPGRLGGRSADPEARRAGRAGRGDLRGRRRPPRGAERGARGAHRRGAPPDRPALRPREGRAALRRVRARTAPPRGARTRRRGTARPAPGGRRGAGSRRGGGDRRPGRRAGPGGPGPDRVGRRLARPGPAGPGARRRRVGAGPLLTALDRGGRTRRAPGLGRARRAAARRGGGGGAGGPVLPRGMAVDGGPPQRRARRRGRHPGRRPAAGRPARRRAGGGARCAVRGTRPVHRVAVVPGPARPAAVAAVAHPDAAVREPAVLLAAALPDAARAVADDLAELTAGDPPPVSPEESLPHDDSFMKGERKTYWTAALALLRIGDPRWRAAVARGLRRRPVPVLHTVVAARPRFDEELFDAARDGLRLTLDRSEPTAGTGYEAPGVLDRVRLLVSWGDECRPAL